MFDSEVVQLDYDQGAQQIAVSSRVKTVLIKGANAPRQVQRPQTQSGLW